MCTQLQRLICRFLLICGCISWFSNYVGSQVISAPVGFTAVLPCTVNFTSVLAPHVLWKIDKEIVFERLGEEAYEGEGYGGRVDVPEDELRKGNCSLVLKNVSVTDAGIYRSFLLVRRVKRASSTVWSLIQRVELSVHVPDKSPRLPPATDDAGMNSPHLLMMALSLLSLLHVTHIKAKMEIL